MAATLQALLLITVAADARYWSGNKYKSIVRDDGLRNQQDDQTAEDAFALPAPLPSDYDQSAQDTNATASKNPVTASETEAETNQGSADMKTASQESGSSPSSDAAGEGHRSGGNFVETATRTTAADPGGDLGDARQEFWSDAAAGQADKRKTMERPRKAEVQPADDPDYPFHMNTEVGMELIDARRTEDGGLKGDSAMVFDAEANNGKEENKRKNFFKSDTFFQEIVEDTRNLAEATDMIQKALGHHNKALLDIKDKFANMKTKYEGAIKTVSTGFEKVKTDAEKLLTEKFEADPFTDRQKLENYNEKDAEGDEEKKKNIDDFEFKDDPWKAWEPSVTDGEDDGRKKKDPLLAEINKLKEGEALNGGYELPPPPAPLNGEGDAAPAAS